MTSKFLMCAPEFFEVSYEINPWMQGNIQQSNKELATRQWQALYEKISKVAEITLLEPAPNLPDMVFTANAGIVKNKEFIMSNFLHPERKGEEKHFAKWFAEAGYDVLEMPEYLPFEGAGDALYSSDGAILWCGWGHRSALECAKDIASILDVGTIPLELVDDRFYHLDTCFCPLENGYVMYYPNAIGKDGNALIARNVAPKKLIKVSDEDALNFACNAVNIGTDIFLNRASDELKNQLNNAGFSVFETDLSEFMKAGGSAKCLTMKID